MFDFICGYTHLTRLLLVDTKPAGMAFDILTVDKAVYHHASHGESRSFEAPRDDTRKNNPDNSVMSVSMPRKAKRTVMAKHISISMPCEANARNTWRNEC